MQIQDVLNLQAEIRKDKSNIIILDSMIIPLILRKCQDVMMSDNDEQIKELYRLAVLAICMKKQDMKPYFIEVGGLNSIFHLIGDMVLRQSNGDDVECELQDIALIALKTIELQGYEIVNLKNTNLESEVLPCIIDQEL